MKHLATIKANKIDQEHQMKAIDILHRQNNLILVVVIEMIKQLLNESNDSVAAIKSKRKYILEQAINVNRWTQEFDPQNINYIDMKVPKRL